MNSLLQQVGVVFFSPPSLMVGYFFPLQVSMVWNAKIWWGGLGWVWGMVLYRMEG